MSGFPIIRQGLVINFVFPLYVLRTPGSPRSSRELYFQQVDFPLGQTQRLRDKVHQQVNIPNGYFMFLSRLQGNKTDVLKHLVNMIGSYIRTNQFLLFSCLLAPEFYLDMRT